MRKRLPPLTTLEGFEAAARLGSFSAAADALNLTQSAISHQIRMLEESLGQPVFRRLHRRVVLTDAGRDFQRSVAATLDVLREGVSRLEPYKKPGSVIVYCDPALANGWLAQRLPDLKARYPRIDIWLDTTGRAIDFALDEVDILIKRYPVAQVPLMPQDVDLHCLFEEILRPMASLRLAAKLKGLPPREWLRRSCLLHEEGFDGWPQWFDSDRADAREAGLGTSAELLNAGANFSDAFVMQQGVIAGLGVALGWSVIAEPWIRDRRLKWLSAKTVSSPNAYFIAAQHSTLADADIRITFDWIRTSAKAV